MIMRELEIRSGDTMALPPGAVVESYTVPGNSLGYVLVAIWSYEGGYAGVAQWGAVWSSDTIILSDYAVQTAMGASVERVQEQLLAPYSDNEEE